MEPTLDIAGFTKRDAEDNLYFNATTLSLKRADYQDSQLAQVSTKTGMKG